MSANEKPNPTTRELLSLLCSEPGQEEVKTTLSALFRRVEAIRDRSMRPQVVQGFLVELDNALLVCSLRELISSSEHGSRTARTVLVELGLDPGLVASLEYERIQNLYSLATDANFPEVAAIFLGPRVNRKRLRKAWPENQYMDIPLGNRRQAARGRDRFKLDRLLHDRDHRVIQILLDNPRVVERDVVRIAAQRPTRPEVIRCVSSHRRWAACYPVRKALAANPYTPEDIAIGLLPTLLLQDLKFIISSGILLPEVHQAAEATLKRRTHRDHPEGEE